MTRHSAEPTSRHLNYILLFEPDGNMISDTANLMANIATHSPHLTNNALPTNLQQLLGTENFKQLQKITKNFTHSVNELSVDSPTLGKVYLHFSPSNIHGKPVASLHVTTKLQTEFEHELSPYRVAADGTQLGVWDVHLPTAQGRYEFIDFLHDFLHSEDLYFSSKFIALLDLPRDETITWQHIKQLMFEDDIATFDSLLMNHLEFKAPLSIECRIKNREGVYQWYEIRGESQRNQQGFPIRVTGSIQNCTFHKDMINSVLESEQSKRLALDAANIGVWTYHIKDNAWTWDNIFNQIYQFTPEQQGNNDIWKNCIHPDDKDKVIQALALTATEGHPFQVDYRIITPDKQVRNIIARGHVSNNVFGQACRVEGICFDNSTITHAKNQINEIKSELENRVKQRTKELEASRDLAEAGSHSKSKFLAMMSHEIRTPMNGVIGALDLVDKSQLNTGQQELISTAKESALNLVSILNDILDLSKIEAGKFSLDLADMSISEVVNSAVALHANLAQSKGIKFSINESLDYHDFVNSDPIRLRQILSNLLSNAIKFTEPTSEKAGEISLTISKDEQQSLGPVQYIKFQVKDNGIGIKKSALSRLFSPFSQAEDSTTRKYGGTGLGLSICGRLSDLLGGNLSVNSEFGQGSTFTLGVPFWPAKTQDDLVSYWGEEILLVGNFSDDLHWVADYMQTNGAFVDKASIASLVTEQGKQQLNDANHIVVSGLTLSQTEIEKLLKLIAPQYYSKITLWTSQQNLAWFHLNAKELACIQSTPITSYKVKQLTKNDDVDLSQCEVTTPTSDTANQSAQMQTINKRINEGIHNESDILVVEDNPMNQKLLLLQLEQLGYHADVAANGYEGLNMYKQHGYTLVITDCHMPEMDGYDLASSIRQLERTSQKHIPIVALTGAAMTGDKEKCISAGMDDYLSKPIQTRQLKQAIEKWLNTQH
ncbi:hypothetical protein C2869_02355 [Saccharobesus litoralis]|uniref:histidine kinase n=1 Tax=Saccharobesus litoralis TaxID=2172099 RepID=A0A2S0VMA3_9ALTE|nr:PAS domain-containing hybrid sensor histidine kinase/response regulator [Saccharobesus litoralis]AWB65353.1 hypothetical protein C2869_02355 [Saccharobesus litoralis]